MIRRHKLYPNCDKKRVEKALISIGKKELQDMIDEGKEIEVNCHFCNRNYAFLVELKEMLNKAARLRRRSHRKKDYQRKLTVFFNHLLNSNIAYSQNIGVNI